MKFLLLLPFFTLLFVSFLNACETNEWEDTTGACIPCHFSCESCTNSGDNHCSSCSSDKTLTNGFCKCTTETQFVDKDGVCKDCFSSCKTCIGPLFFQCTSCDTVNGQELIKYDWEMNGTCECSDNTKFAVNGAACGTCDTSCLKCLGTGPEKCIKCSNETLKQPWGKDIPGYCITPCQYKQFRDMTAATSTDQICRTCSSLCSNCSGPSATECTGCIDGYFLKGIMGHPGECLQECTTTHTYRDDTGGCSQCDVSCGECFGPSKQECYFCTSGYYEIDTDEYFMCVEVCESGKFRDMISGNCEPCHENCQECKGPNNGDCMNCKSGFHKTPYFEELGQCLVEENCGTKQYRDTNDVCMPCHDTCLHCKGPTSGECLECDYQLAKVPPAKELIGYCLVLCEDRMQFRDAANGLCIQCHESCEECTGPSDSNCLKCADSTKVIYPMIEGYPGQCVTPCLEHYFWNGTHCVECHSTCEKCMGLEPNQCIECPAGSVKEPLEKGISGVCFVEDCEAGKFKIEEPDVCGDCDASCLTCRKEGEFGCLTCDASKVKVPAYDDALGKCMDNTCTANQYINIHDNYQCADCFSSCATCIGGSDMECLVCAADHYKFPVGFDDTMPGFCVQLLAADDYSCDTHKIRNMETGSCEECPESCVECAGISEKKCLKCYEGMIKVPAMEGKPGQCLMPCQSHFYRLNPMDECLECHESCQECEGGTAADCLSCDSPKLKQPPTKNVIGFCVQDCGTGKFFDLSLNDCGDCNPSCQECSGSTADDCLACDPATSVKVPWGHDIPGVCLTGTCADGTYGIMIETSQTLSCETCNSLCTTCMGPDDYQCLTCAASEAKLPPDVNMPGKCYTPCVDTTQYKDVYGDNTCKPCFSNCLTCIGPLKSDCLTCKSEFTKIYNQGDDSLPSICEEATWCPEHQYYDGASCQECDNSCRNCIGPGNDKCIECFEGMVKMPWNKFVEGSCVPECPQTSTGLPQFYDISDDQCKPCDQSCGACMGPNPEDCLKCQDETLVKYPMLIGVKGICVAACTEGDNYYLTDASTTPITCAQCHSTCAKCVDNLEESCLECSGNYYKKPSEKESVGRCLVVCTDPSPGYRDETDTCQACHSDCGSCINGGEWDCLTCTGTNVKIPSKDDVPGKCFAACPNGQYLNESDFLCHDCHSSCATCIGGHMDQCLTCATDLFKNPLDLTNFDLSLPGLCETFFYCPQLNQYRSITDTECQPCDSTCAECFGQGPENCRHCADGLGKYPFNVDTPGYCLAPCPLAFQYPDPSGTCMDCHDSCDLCFGNTETDCLTCRDLTLVKYPLTEGVKGKCEPPCEHGFYRDPIDYSKCEPCHYTCMTCMGPNKEDCLMCVDNYIKFDLNKPGICEVPCTNPSEYKDIQTQTCKPCHSTCFNCTGPEAHQCLSCQPDFVPSEPYKYVMVSCLQKCESTIPQFRNIATNNCEDCHHSCLSCFGPDDWQCLSCPEGVMREFDEFDQPTRCLDKCHPGYFLIIESDGSWKCNQCISDCLECVGPSASECTLCPEGKEKIPKYEPGICVDKCEFANQYHDPTNVNICKACHPDCAECAGPEANQCFKCAVNNEGKVKWPPAQDIIGVCIVLNCSDGQYKDENGDCQSCPANCKSCIANDPNKCIDCMDDYVKHPPKFGEPTACVADPCLDAGAPNPGYVSEEDATVCAACNESCASCLHGGKDGCLSCPVGSTKVPSGIDIPGVCVIACADGFFRNFTNSSYQVCSPCHPNCATCEGPEDWECLTCITGLFLNKINTYMGVGTCDTIGYCPEGQYGDPADYQCKDCLQDSCLFCVGPLITDCKHCADGFEKLPPSPDLLGQCVEPCLDAYTFRDATGACVSCDPSCITCTGSSDMECLICKNDTLIKYPKQEGVPGKCQVPCTDHQYRTATDDYETCYDCDNSCENCKGPSPSECLTCPSGYTKIPFDPKVIGSCFLNCALSTEYRGSDGSCYPCNTKCLSCVGPSSQDCLSCPAGMQRLNPDIRFNTSCVQACEIGKFWNVLNNTCDPCHHTCKTCMGGKDYDCLSCKDHVVNSVVSGTVGVCGKLEQGIWCEPHFYMNSTADMTCAACHSSCSECQGNLSTDCTKCFDLFELFLAAATDMKGECMQICDNGFFRNGSGLCAPCDESCMECKGPGIYDCKFCSEDFVKMPPAFELLGRCVLACSNGEYRDLDGTCQSCATECATCSGNETNECLSCPLGKILDQTKYGVPGSCITNTCADDQFFDGTNCVNCSANCETCVGPEIWECLSCAADKVKYPAEIGIPAHCLTACEPNFYRDISNWEFQECKPCHSSCKTCEGPEPWQCLTCADGLFFNGMLEFIGEITGTCETEGKCPDFFYRVLDTSDPANPIDHCVACHETCLRCNGTTENDCLDCPTYLIKYPPAIGVAGNCLEYCEFGYYRDVSTGDCAQCNVACLECVGGTDADCLKCAEDPTVILIKYPLTYGVPGKCIPEGTCADNQYADPTDDWNCKDCNTECATCSGPTNDNCLSCPDGYFKEPFEDGVPGVCIQACSDVHQYKDADDVCQQCDSTCDTCIGAGPAKCLSCVATKMKVPPADKIAGYCLTPCSLSHQYRSKQDLQCYECHSACKTCIGNTEFDCLSCYENVEYFSFYNGTKECYTWCKEHQYKDASGACKECDPMCAECSIQGPGNCWSCWEGYVKIPEDPTVVGTCYEKCQEGTYRSTDGYCKPCEPSCKTCEGGTNLDCLSCAVDGFSKVPALPKVKGECLQNDCTSSQYLNASGCQNCNETCATCVGPDDIDCMTCPVDKVKFPFEPDKPGKCVDACGVGFYRKNETFCGYCHDSCLSCIDGTEKGCLTCEAPKVLQADASLIGACVEPCEVGFYRDFASTYKECKPCYYSCAECTGPDPWLCKACAIGYHFNGFEGTDFGTCDVDGICLDHQFRNSDDNCEECDDACKECSVIATNCTMCSYEFILIEGKCLLPCDQALQPSTYRDASSNLCEPCHSSCKECVGPLETDCLICALATQTKYPTIEGEKGQCFDSCATTEYYDIGTDTCKPCNETCTSCVGGLSSDCLTCVATLIKKNPDPKIASECIPATCNSSQYLSPDGTCKPCSLKCQACVGFSEFDCVSCDSGKILQKMNGDYKGQCIAPCGTGQFRKSDGTCGNCHANCVNCTGEFAWNCLSCVSGLHKNPYNWTEGTCDEFGECPMINQFRNSQDICQDCHSSCKECFGAYENQCRICSDDKKMKIPSSYELPGYCAFPCSTEGRYRKTDGTCASCHSSCLICSGPYDYQCEVCVDTTKMKSPQLIGYPGKCVDPCPETFQYYNSAMQCVNCSELCATCMGGGDDQCLSCIDNYYKLPAGETAGKCYQKCATKEYRDPYNNTCMGCHDSCAECIGPTDYDCIECNSGYYKEYPEASFVGKCFEACAAKEFRGYDGTCYACFENCAECTGPSEDMCLSCESNFFLNPPGTQLGRCESKAMCFNEHQYRDPADDTCKECDASCVTCFDAGATNCQSCPIGKMKIPLSPDEPGSCLDECPKGQYNSGGACADCAVECETCTGGTANDCLICANHSMIKMPPAIDQPGFCAAPCADGEYASSAGSCASCNPACLSCVGGTDADCLVCAGDKIKYPAGVDKKGSCLTPCEDTTQFRTVEGDDCKPCFEGCLTCSGPTQLDCMSCTAPLVKNTPLGEPGACVKGCSSSHQYPDADGICQECDSSCLTCKGPGMYSCLTCASGQQKHPPSTDKLGLCSSCELHQFLDTSGTGYCEECSYACATCYGLLYGNCMSCNATEFRTLITVDTSVYPYEKECQCMNYYVEEEDPLDADKTVCNECHYTCMKCSASATETACTDCEETKGRIFDSDTNTCICNELGYYTIADQLQCGICYPTCKRCSNDSRFGCLECHGAIDVEPDGSCGCPNGTYLNDQFLCVNPEDCGNGLVGIVSEANAENTGNICGPKPCPVPFFYNYTTIECKEKCATGCLTCINANETTCQTCIDSHYWTYFGSTGTCTANCNESYYYVPKSINPLNMSTCEQKCPNGYGPIENVTQKCQQCHSKCLTCYKANDEFACDSCESPLSLSDSYGSQQFNNRSFSKKTCQKCKAGYFVAVTPRINDSSVTAANETCISSCLKGQYEDILNRECVNCKDLNCITCSESYDYCQLCLTGYDLIEGICYAEANQESCIKSGKYIKGTNLECVDECGTGYYQNTLTHICEKCDGSCETCSGGEDPNKCLTCAGNRLYYKTKKSCVYQCPVGTYLSETSTGEKTCSECITGCGSCTGPAISDCNQCADSYFMISNSEGALSDCVQDCSKFDSNTYGDAATLTCQACNSKCKTCVNGLATGCLSCNNDDIFSKTSATDVGGSCKVKSDQKNEYKQKSASDITSSSADELQQQATEIVEAFSQTVTTTTATTTSDDNNDGTTDTTDSTATKEIVTTQSKEEIEQEQEKKKELIAAVITTAKEMSAKDDLTTTEAKSLVEAMKYSVKPEVSVTMVTSDGEKVESTALADDSTEEVARKFEKDEAITICDTLTNIADKIDVKENKEVTEDMFSAASDLLKQTSTLQQDKKVAKGQIESINENADETKQEQIKEDMEVVKKVVEFCDTLSKKIKEKLSPGESMKFNTTEMKLQVNKFSTGDKNSLKESIVSSLSYIETTATTTATTTDTTDGTTTDGTNIDGTTTDSTTQYYNENGEQVDETDPTRTINPPEVIIKDQLIDNLNDQLDKLREQGKNVDSLTVKKASFDLDINSLSKNTSNETEGTTVSDFTRASHLQQFGFELDDGTKVNISDLADDAQFEIQFDYIPETSASYSCVYWNEETEQYDSTGVYLDPATKKCKAKHLTDFIVQKIKNNNKHVFNYGILAVVIPIAICIILFSVWFFRNKKHQVTSFESIGDDIDFTTLSPFISIWKTKTIPEALNKTMHLACYLISVMMFLALFFRDSVDIDSSFDKLLAAGLVFGLSFTIIIKYFLGAIKEYTQSQPWIYFVVSICYFAACSGITIWRMNSLNSDEAWNWFHSMYIIFIFDFVILDTLIIVVLKMGLWKKWKKIQAYFSFGGFLIIPKGQSEQMQAKGTAILDLERGRKSSSSDKQQFSNDVVVVDNLAEGEQFGSRPQSKSGMLKN